MSDDDEEEDFYESENDDESSDEDDGDEEAALAEEEAMSTSKKLNVQVIKYINPRLTSDMLSAFELTQAIGFRAALIEKNSDPMVDYKKLGLDKSISIAEEELRQGKFIFTVRRSIYEEDGVEWVEEWDIKDLILPLEFVYEEENKNAWKSTIISK